MKRGRNEERKGCREEGMKRGRNGKMKKWREEGMERGRNGRRNVNKTNKNGKACLAFKNEGIV